MCGCVCVCMYSGSYVRIINKKKKDQMPPKTFHGKTQQRGYVVFCFSLPCILKHSEVPLFRISISDQCCLTRSLPTPASSGTQLNSVVGKYEGSVSQGRR